MATNDTTIIRNSSDFSYSKGVFRGSYSDVGLLGRRLPTTITVVSDKTGATLSFVMDTELAVQNEFWDGEAMAWKSTNPEIPCKIFLQNA